MLVSFSINRIWFSRKLPDNRINERAIYHSIISASRKNPAGIELRIRRAFSASAHRAAQAVARQL
jgi:hypothetical protein